MTNSNDELDAKEIFLQALRFDFSGHVLVLHAHRTWSSGSGIQQTQTAGGGTLTTVSGGMRPPTIVAAMVTEAFCVELYLKTIYRMEQMKCPKAHGLDRLFHGLPDPWKDRMRAKYLAEIQRSLFDESRKSAEFPKDLDACLAQAALAFEMWRYSYEKDPPSQFLGAARFAIYKSILNVEPSWEELRKNLDTPPTPQAL